MIPLPGWGKPLAAVIGLALLAGAITWNNSHQQDLGYAQAVADFQKQKDKDIAALEEKNKALRARAQLAEDQGEQRAKYLVKQLADVRAVSGGLRDTVRKLQSDLPELSCDAARSLAGRGLGLLDRCQERYLDMAERAQRRASYIQTLKAAWPQGE